MIEEAWRELVFDGASVDLGAKGDAEFALSLWYERGMLGNAKPGIAELSFKYALSEGAVRQELPPGAHSRSSRPYNPISRSGQARTARRRHPRRCLQPATDRAVKNPWSEHSSGADKRKALTAEMAVRFAALVGTEAAALFHMQAERDIWDARKGPTLTRLGG